MTTEQNKLNALIKRVESEIKKIKEKGLQPDTIYMNESDANIIINSLKVTYDHKIWPTKLLGYPVCVTNNVEEIKIDTRSR